MPATWVWKKCLVCGKKIEVFDGQWGYKINERREKYYCSYHCMRAAEAEAESKKGKPRTEKEDEINRMIASGASTREIVEKLGVKRSTVWYYRERFVPDDEEDAG